MKKPTLIALLLFVLTSFFAFSQGEWIEETIDPETGLRTGKIKVNDIIYEIGVGVRLTSVDFSEVDLSNCNLNGATLWGNWDSNLYEILGETAGRNGTFKKANLKGASLIGARIVQINFSGANLEGANFTSAVITDGSYIGTNLKGAKFLNAEINGTDFLETNFEEADFNRTRLNISQSVRFQSCKLKGVDFTKIRTGNTETPLLKDLRDSDLTGAKLNGCTIEYARGANLSYANCENSRFYFGGDLEDVIIKGTNFTGALIEREFKNVELVETNFTNAEFKRGFINATYKSGNFDGAIFQQSWNFESIDLRGFSFKSAKANHANFSNANLEGVNCEAASFQDSDFSNASMKGVILKNSDLSWVKFVEADLQNSDLRNIEGSSINFDNANLDHAQFEGADLYQAFGQFTGTPLSNPLGYSLLRGYFIGANSNLTGADLSNLDLTGVSLIGAQINGTNLSGSNLSNVQRYGLDGYNLKKIDNLEKDSVAKDEKIAALENRLALIEAQLAGIDNANVIKELVEQVAELQERPTIEQVRDARAGSVVLTVDPDGNNITLGLTIEQSDNLTEWTKLDGEMTRTIPIPDGKKFYRFALDK